jgi:hypothetical protein
MVITKGRKTTAPPLVGRELGGHVSQAGRDGHEITVVNLVTCNDPLAAEQHHAGTVTADP